MITPLEIENKKFAKQMVNGYNVDEVDEFLDEITLDYEKAYKEATDLREKLQEATRSMEQYKNLENTLQNTLVMAQSAAEETKNLAKQQAEQLVKEAQLEAKTSVDELNQEITLKKKELEEIKKQFDIYKAKMESLLISQLELLKDTNED